MRFFLLILFFFNLEASKISQKKYFDLIDLYPHLVHTKGLASRGEIEIVLDPAKMESIEKKQGRDVGVIAQDKYWLWINDACVFPSGAEGIYGRILWTNSLKAVSGVAVMPVFPNGKVVLNCNFRHATRSWEIELPRGGALVGESREEAAYRETLEETGMCVESLSFLGQMPCDTGLTNTEISVFSAIVREKKETQQEETEAIEKILYLSISEIKRAFTDGYYRCTIRGEEKRVNFRDPVLVYALFMYELERGSDVTL